MSRTNILVVAFLVASAAIQLWVHLEDRSSRAPSRLKEGAAAPVLSLQDLNGRSVALDEFRGKIVILDFWATWCAPCAAEFRFLVPWWQEQLRKGHLDDVVVIAVNVNEPRERVQAYLESTPLPFMVLLDPDGAVATEYAVTALPTMVIIDREGRVIDSETGYDPSVGMTLTARLAAIRDGESE